MTRIHRILLAAFTLTTAAVARGQATQATTVDPATWVPADAVFYLGIADTQQAFIDFRRTAAYALFSDPQLKRGWKNAQVVAQLSERLRERLARTLDVPLEQLKNPFGGPAAAYVLRPPGDSADAAPIVGVIAGVRDAGLMKAYYEQAVRKLRDAVDRHETIACAGQEIFEFHKDRAKAPTSQAEDDDLEIDWSDADDQDLAEKLKKALDAFLSPEALPERFATCLTEDRLILASSADELKAILRRDAATPTLATSDDYQTLLRVFEPAGAVRMVLNLPRLFQWLAAEDPDARQTLAALGTESMRSLVAHLRLGDDACDVKAEALLLLAGERAGLPKILSLDNRVVAPPAYVSSDVVGYASLNVQVLELFDQIEGILRKRDAQAADDLRAGLDAAPLPSGATLNLRRDFLAHLRPPALFTLELGRPERPARPESVRLLTTIEHADRQSVEKVLAQIPMVVPRPIDGSRLYEFPIAGIALAATGDRVLGGNTDAVENALTATKTTTLASTPEFQRAAQLVPAEAWGVFYLDKRRFMDALLGMKAASDEDDVEAMVTPGSLFLEWAREAFLADLKEETLAEARRVLQYSAPSMTTVATTVDGVRLTYVLLKPAPP